MKTIDRSWLLACLLALSPFAHGESVPAPDIPAFTPQPVTALAKKLERLYPGTAIGTVQTTPWPGVFEVQMGGTLAYVDATGQWFLFGHLYDMRTQRDLTAERKDTIARIDFATLPLQDALEEVRGRGTRVLAIFTDPDCPYCRKLEPELASLDDVTLYRFLMPLVRLHAEARGRAIGVWCSPDRLRAWHALMHRNEPPTARACDHPVDRTLALAERLGVSGTPTLVAADGRVLPGAASAAQIEAWLTRSSVAAEGAGR